MDRTTIMLPVALKLKALEYARKKKVSLGELIRSSLATLLRSSSLSPKRDPLFSDTSVYRGSAPMDSSQNHDRYLYGEKE